MKELEIRFLVESIEGTYCVSGYVLEDDKVLLTEGDGEVHALPVEDIIQVIKETVIKEDVTGTVKKQELVTLV